MARLAQAAFDNVQRSLTLDLGAQSWIVYEEKSGTNQYGGPFTTDETAQFLIEIHSSLLAGVVNRIDNQKNFVPKLVELAHQSKDLWTINRIAKKLNDITGVDFYPWDLHPLDSWWEQNSMNFTNWPFDEYSKGIDAVKACRYDQALTNLDFVLTIDPTADKSRALAVACAIEIGNLQKAQQLNTNYAIGDGRWNNGHREE